MPNSDEYDRWDVIVVGAGAAGVSAARRLHDAGRKVVVLEARDRTGGRLWTDHTTMTIPHERGASLVVGGPETPTWPWGAQAGLVARKFVKNMSRYGTAGPWVDWTDPEYFAFPRLTSALPASVPDPDRDETADQYLARVGIAPENYPLALLGIQVDSEQFDKLDATSVVHTLRQCLEVARTGRAPTRVHSGYFKLLGPYDSIIDLIAAPIEVRLNTAVDTIDYSGTGVTVQAGPHTFEASKCIIAVPLGVLQQERISFVPGLEADRLRALSEISYLTACKTILEFDHPVRPEDFDMADQHDHAPCQFWDETAGWPGYQGQIIVTWDTGDRARDMLAMPEQQRFDVALAGVQRLAGDPGLKYVNASSWSRRPSLRLIARSETGRPPLISKNASG